MTTPLMLKKRCIRAVRLAFWPEVRPAMRATTQEPMLDPIVRKMPWSMLISRVTTIARAMEVITEELWMMAVSKAPMRTSSTGLLMRARKSFTESRAAKSDIDWLIRSRPTKSIPKPVRMPPILFQNSFLAKRVMKAPMPAKAEKMMAVVRALPAPNIPRATICAVMVVPMLAP